MGNLTERDYLSYRKVFDIVIASLPAPDLLIYLRAPIDVLMSRIKQRGRAIESGIDEDYLRLLNSFYDDWLETFDICPVLTIRSDDLDFVHKAQHLDVVIHHIREILTGKEEVVF
jgi:deoxyadenosine/deoxycytidine kinase